MTSFERRYAAGDHEGVWADMRRLGPVPDHLSEDCAAVAAETMRRVHRHVARLGNALEELRLVPIAGLDMLKPPTPADHAELEALAGEVGTLPFALDACLRHVGRVLFAGDCPAVDLTWAEGDQYDVASLYPDPLVLPDAEHLRYCWSEHRERLRACPEPVEPGFLFEFAPDELHKANISGSTHDILLPEAVADPVIRGVEGRPDITLVEYLRLSIAWGGMPGWSFRPDRAPAALAALRVRPDF
ncbi:hypothetical protein [Kitasatospora sp. NPDC057198]|uniref:hypothetical protein n=1 Tax=Kitasatospora sp. NPDC057198 TaxID=3346046 RepID=UPI0036255510